MMNRFARSHGAMCHIVCSFLLSVLLSSCGRESRPVVVAYVTSWSDAMPDPTVTTHINYAFGHVNATFDGIRIENETRLKTIAGLKKQHPELKILLSIGGWESGGFSEMAADSSLRTAFAAACADVVGNFSLDGIDIDWEYPGSDAAGISASPEDTGNYTLLMQAIRASIGERRLLTLASQAAAGHIDFPAILPYIDFVNIMAYDIDNPPYHHAGLYRSEHTRGMSVDESVQAHLKAGVPTGKLVLGVPFYGRCRGTMNLFTSFRQLEKTTDYARQWDDIAKAPYLTEGDSIICSYENERSLSYKCDYIRQTGLLGIMYWSLDGDDEKGALQQAIVRRLWAKETLSALP